ncbi:hypothetical protein J3E68DRAFT_406296 [Trichoderma sp. SZMC 28012]
MYGIYLLLVLDFILLFKRRSGMQSFHISSPTPQKNVTEFKLPAFILWAYISHYRITSLPSQSRPAEFRTSSQNHKTTMGNYKFTPGSSI